MNIRTTLAALTLGLASSLAMAATTPATPAAPSKAISATAAAPTKFKALANKTKECKPGATLVKGKCEKAKAHT